MNDEDLLSEKEVDKIFDNFKKTEEEGVRNILKYFDRIHDKLFTFNNILIAGYFALSQLVGSISSLTIIIPIVNLGILIFIEYRMMEKSRFEASITKKTREDIDKNGLSINRTNQFSLLAILSTLTVVIIFLIYLFSNPENDKIIIKSNKELFSKEILEIDTLRNSQTKDTMGTIKNIQLEIDRLTDYFGDENLRKDVMQSTNDTSDNLFVNDAIYKNIRITHIPTGIHMIGDSTDNIEENLLIALRKLKEEVKTKKNIK